MMISRTKQLGLSLVELMISVVAGLVVVGGVTSVYISTVQSSSEALQQSKLNQELGALLSVMSNDIRRAGIWGNMDTSDYDNPQGNPFSETSGDITALTVVDNMTSNTAIDLLSATSSATSGSCILYAYDAVDPQHSVQAQDIFGFRLNNGVVQMLDQTVVGATNHHDQNCSGTNWIDITDADVFTVTNLTFDLANSTCTNGAEPNGLDDDGDSNIDNDEEIACYTVAPSGGDIISEIRQVDITIAGQLTEDSMVQANMSQTVRVRNDLVREM